VRARRDCAGSPGARSCGAITLVAHSDAWTQAAESLHHFAGQGDVAKVQDLIEAGADVDQQDADGASPLHWAADRGAADVAQCLLDRGADVSVRDASGMTALHYAACSGQREVRSTVCST
jgi:ankyrin repeat protein